MFVGTPCLCFGGLPTTFGFLVAPEIQGVQGSVGTSQPILTGAFVGNEGPQDLTKHQSVEIPCLTGVLWPLGGHRRRRTEGPRLGD